MGADRRRRGRRARRREARRGGNRRALQAAPRELQEAGEDRLLRRAAAEPARQGVEEGSQERDGRVKRAAAAPVRFERRGAVAVLTLSDAARGNRFDAAAAL